MMTQDIIRTQAEIAEATMPVLVATYNAMTGKEIKKFENRAVAERRVAMALLSATDAAGHAGVKPGEKPMPKTVDEIAVKTGKKPFPKPEDYDLGVAVVEGGPTKKAIGGEAQPDEVDTTAAPTVNPFKPGQLGHDLWDAVKAAEPIAKRQKAERKPRTEGAQILLAVRATGAGKSRVQEGSVRAAVLAYVTAAENKTVTIAAMDHHFGHPTRGYVQKLLEKEHLVDANT